MTLGLGELHYLFLSLDKRLDKKLELNYLLMFLYLVRLVSSEML